jgi:hypothetical protein
MYVSVFLAGPSVALLLLWASHFRTVLGRAGGAGRKLFQYGAVLLAAGILVDAVFELAVTSASDNRQPAVAQTMNVLVNDSWIPPIVGMAVLLIGAGLGVVRAGLLPRWMGLVALVAGVVSLLGPGGFLGFFVGPLWIAASGVMLYTRKDQPAAVAA